MKRKVLSMLLALVMVLSMVPAQVFAVATGDGSVESPWQIGDTVTNDGSSEPEGVCVDNSYWEREDIAATETAVCETEEHSHTECVYDETLAAYTCGLEEHAHDEACVEVTEGYTLWTLTEKPAAKEHLRLEAVPLAETEYTVTFQARNESGGSLRYVEIMIVDEDGDTVDYVTTNSNGRGTYDLPAGNYTAICSYTSGNYVYYAEEDFTVTNQNITVTLTVKSEYSIDAAQATYNNTTYFNHVDVRVKGTYTTGTTVDLTTYDIRLANVHISVQNPSAYSRYDFEQTFTNNSETYEWHKASVRVYKGASVTLTCDIYNSQTGEIMLSNFTYTFYDGTHNGVNYGSTEFVKAVQQCDIHQGLDFIIAPQDIIEAVFYSVHYDWDVVDANGNNVGELPAGLATLPAAVEYEYESGENHTIDAHHKEGHYVVDEQNGKLYTFGGWDWWSHESDNNPKQNVIGSNSTTLTITDNTVIYGVWTVTDMDLADSHITITKKFQDSTGAKIEAPEEYHMKLSAPGGDLEIALSQFTYDQTTGIYSYSLPVYTEGTYTITEHEYDIAGYEADASITVSESAYAIASQHNHVTAGKGTVAADKATFSLDLDYDTGSACADVGEVNFVNTYTKTLGSPVYNYPNLTVDKLDADDRSPLEGATFILYKNYENSKFSDEVASGTSDESGYLYFRNLEPGTYYLTETVAPEGYLVGFAIYQVNIKQKEGFPTQILYDNAWCDYYEYDMSVDYSLDDGVTWTASQHFSVGTTTNRFRLAAFNEKVSGQLTITKTFTGLDTDDIPASVTVTVTYPDGSTTDHVLSQSNNWTTTLTGLELGTYYVSETAPQIEGYLLSGVTYNGSTSGKVEIGIDDIPNEYDRNEPVAEESVTVNNTYDKREGEKYVWSNLEILKVRDANGEPLSGATFAMGVISGQSSTFYREATTDTTGKVTFVDVGKEYKPETAPKVGDVLATFDVYEYTAPAGYAGMEGTYTVKVVVESITKMEDPSDGVFYTIYTTALEITDTYTGYPVALTNGALVVKNTKNEGTLTIKKTFGVNNAYIPASITATVTGPNGYSQEVTLSASNNWTVTLTELDLGTYTVKEPETVTNIDGHPLYAADSTTEVTVTLSSGVENGVDLSNGEAVLKNTYTRKVINPAAFQIKKVDSKTGAVITTGAEFTLYSDQACTQEVQSQNTGTDGIATFYGFAEEATYYLKETEAPAGYVLADTVWKVTVSLKGEQPTIEVNSTSNIWETIYNWIARIDSDDWANGILTIKNEKQTGSLTISKTVVDPEGHYADAEYSFTLDASDNAFDQTFTLKNGERKTVKNIPYGTTYTVTENTTGAAYTCSITDSGNGMIWAGDTVVTVVNTYRYQENNPGLNLLKVDADTAEPIKGAVFYVYYDEDCTSAMNHGTTDGDGKVNIPFGSYDYDTYYLKETAPAEGYYPSETVYVISAETKYVVRNEGTDDAYTEKQQVLTVAGLGNPTVDASNDIKYTYTVENTAIKPVTITATKAWEDGGYYNRPNTVNAILYRDGVQYERVTLNEANGWTYTWEGEEYTDEYTWTVDEATVPEGYTKSVADAGDEGAYTFTITNTRAPKAVEITVTKAWEHNNGKTLPESVTVTLYKNGESYESVTLNEANGWTYTWTGLTDVYAWSVDETEVPTGYEKEITIDGYSFTITNTRTILPITVDVEKVWADGDSKDRPKSVDVVLYRNGEAYETVTLSEDNDWSYSWDLTDAYDWTVDEPTLPKGYKKDVAHSGNSWTITNTLKNIPKTGDDADLLGLSIMGIVGVVGLCFSAIVLFVPRKKKEER